MAAQLDADHLAHLYAERRYQDIVDACTDGRLARVLGVDQDEIDLLDRADHGSLSRDDLTKLHRLGRFEAINQACNEGRIANG